jgi:hypothetical protein
MREKTLQTFESEREQVCQTIERLLVEATPASGERRNAERKPYFRPVSLAVLEGGEWRNFSCFSRDISPCGIGLLHNMPLERGEVELTIQMESAEDVRLKGEIMWCRPCGEGWFTSGARFLSALRKK